MLFGTRKIIKEVTTGEKTTGIPVFGEMCSVYIVKELSYVDFQCIGKFAYGFKKRSLIY